MAYQQGSLKKVWRKQGETWLLRYRTQKPDGKRVENTIVIGLVRKFPKESDAWLEADRLGLRVRINTETQAGRITFAALAEHYLKADFGVDAVRPKADTTTDIVQGYVRNHLIPRWGEDVADEIKPLEVQRWLKSLKNGGLAWPTVAKIRQLMGRIYKVGRLHGLVTKNPTEDVETRTESDYQPIDLTTEQTLAILEGMKSLLHYTLVLTAAATALRASELLSLRWSDILWKEQRIRVSKRWAKGSDGETKTEASDGYVPLGPILFGHLEEWRRRTPYAEETDFVFPSLQENGRVPLCASTFVGDYLRPAAIAAGVEIPKGKRFGLHNLRHTLSNWLVSQDTNAKTVQGLLRHANIKTTLQLYARADAEKTRAAQGSFLDAVGVSEAVQ